jgi:drug/metabolite transporter (DMT)-like permease
MAIVGFLYAIAAAFIWGLVYTIDQQVLRTASPFALLFIDSLLTAFVLLPFVFARENSLSSLYTMSKWTWFLVLSSLVLAALANLFIFSSIRIVGASTASILEIAYPFFVVIFSFLVFRATPSFYSLIGGLLIFLGAAVIIASMK